jgi:Na+-transporting NADH:ubiquinone oxidoreductase subunit NqrF
MFNDNTIYLCVSCGEKTKGKYCPACRTKEGRESVKTQNLAIMRENLEKGHTIPEPYKTLLKTQI